MPKLILPMNVEDIKRILPHRYPFLFLDKVLECTNDCAVGLKNVSANEWFFAGHFPTEPIMPGVLIIEALAQLAGVAIFAAGNNDESGPKAMYFVKIEAATFKGKVVPGDILYLYANKTRNLGKMYFFDVCAKVNEKTIAEAKIVATLAE